MRILAARIEFSPAIWITSGASMIPDAEPRIRSQVSYQRGVSCLFWSNQPARSGLGTIEVANADGFFDDYLQDAIRDTPISLYVGDSDTAEPYLTLVATAVIDRIDASGEDTITIVLADKAAQLDKALQDSLYAGVNNPSIQGQPKPVCFGSAFSVPAVLSSTANLDFDVHDAEFSSIDLVRDQGVLLTDGVGYIRKSDSGVQGFRKLASIAGRIVADVSGAVRNLGDYITAAQGDFVGLVWTAGEPDGWTKAGDPANGTITEVAGGARFNATDFGLQLFYDASMVSGKRYQIEVTTNAVASGSVVLVLGATIIATLTAAGARVITFTADGSTQFYIASNGACDVTINSVRVFEARLIERLPDVIHYLYTTRAGFPADEIDNSAVTALDTVAPYALGGYWQSGVTIRQILDLVMDSYAGWWYVNRFGELSVGRLEDPTGLTATYFLEPYDIPEPGVSTRLDQARGLSLTANGGKNWHVHSDAEVAGSVTAAVRALLTTDYRFRRASIASVSADYGSAGGAGQPIERPIPGAIVSATGIDTLLQDKDDVVTESDRWAGLYSQPRRFYDFPVAFTDDLAALEIEPGDVVQLTYPRFNLEAGRKLLVVSARGEFLSGRLELTLWG